MQPLQHLVFKSEFKSILKSNKTYLHFGHCANMSLHPTKILLYLSVIKNIREWCFVMCRHLSPHQSRDSSFPNPLIYFFILCTYPITCALTESHMLLQIIFGTKRLHWFRIFQFVRVLRNHVLFSVLTQSGCLKTYIWY